MSVSLYKVETNRHSYPCFIYAKSSRELFATPCFLKTVILIRSPWIRLNVKKGHTRGQRAGETPPAYPPPQ